MVSPLAFARAPGRFRPFLLFALSALLPGLLACEGAGIGSLPVRGVIISTHGDGTDWDSPRMGETIDEIAALGANWISIHPYAWVRNHGGVAFDRFDPADPPAWITHPIEEAHRRGLRIQIKPHLGYWGSRFGWRGDIAFEEPGDWERFFEEYTEWITMLAAACAHADAFVVGTELDLTLDHEAAWRSVIAAVRERTPAPLTYAANWTHYRDVPFWDALDHVGIQAYFPLSDHEDPDSSVVVESWARVMREVAAYSERIDRPVIFTELGYNRSYTTAMEPWSYRVDGPEAERAQALCLRVALHAVEQEPCVEGVFLWKWFPNPRPIGRNFQLATPALRQVIRGSWER